MLETDHHPLAFPEGFLFGTATAAYQIEGSVKADGRGTSIWDTFCRRKGATLHGDTGDVASDHYRRMEEDLDLLAELAAPAYRFSVSWPRIQPTGKGPANREGVEFYQRLASGLRERGIAPIPTLYHWDLPQPLEDAGGWVERDTAERFAEYAGIVANALSSDAEMWITLNEPWCSAWLGYGTGRHAPGVRDIGKAVAASHHLLLAHGQAVEAIRSAASAGAAGTRSAQVGITLNVQTIRAASDHPDDAAAARRVDGNVNRLFLDPLFLGRYPADVLEHYGSPEHKPGFAVVRDGDCEIIARPIDFLGVNFYGPHTVASPARRDEANAAGYCVPVGEPDIVAADLEQLTVLRPGARRTSMGWEVDPAALTEMLVRVRSDYATCPLYVTENGAAYDDYVDPTGRIRDEARIRYLDDHLRAVLDARTLDADVRGYFVWSLLDNFEWAYGYSMRFGLVWVDYPSGTRVKKDSFAWYQETVRANALRSPLPPPESL